MAATRHLPSKIVPIFNKRGESRDLFVVHGVCWCCAQETYVFEVTPHYSNDEYVDMCFECIKRTALNCGAIEQ